MPRLLCKDKILIIVSVDLDDVWIATFSSLDWRETILAHLSTWAKSVWIWAVRWPWCVQLSWVWFPQRVPYFIQVTNMWTRVGKGPNVNVEQHKVLRAWGQRHRRQPVTRHLSMINPPFWSCVDAESSSSIRLKETPYIYLIQSAVKCLCWHKCVSSGW